MDEFGSGLRAHLGFEREEPLELLPAVEPPPEPVRSPAEEELERRLEYLAAAEAALLEREQRLAEHEQAAAEEQRQVVEPQPGAPVADVLRRRAEEHADLLWQTFQDALCADDIEVRLAGARALIAAAYPEGLAPRTDTADAVEDELARLRERRFGR